MGKHCTSCGRHKLSEDFHKNPHSADGKHASCKDCRSSQAKDVYHGSQALREKRYDQWCRRKYGVSAEYYHGKLKDQAGLCAICGNAPTKGKLHIDHCHEENQLRDLLCATCNNWLGILEQTEFVSKAVAYLSRHGSVSLSRLRETLLSEDRK